MILSINSNEFYRVISHKYVLILKYILILKVKLIDRVLDIELLAENEFGQPKILIVLLYLF